MTESISSASAAFARLAAIVARLRAPDGCPWDREQTHASLRRHLIEETYEVLDAIAEGDDANLREELGDLLLQPVLHAQIAADEARFDIVEVLEGISDKLVRRHPHVFGEVTAADSEAVLHNWEAIKQAEKAQKNARDGAGTVLEDANTAAPSALQGVPRALPALSLAMGVSKKAAKVGFEWPDVRAVMEKLREETAELEAELQAESPDAERIAEELGDLLFTAVNVARWQKIEPEMALRDTVHRFAARFYIMEELARGRGLSLESLSPPLWEELWREAKESQAQGTKQKNK